MKPPLRMKYFPNLSCTESDTLGVPSFAKFVVFLNIVQKAVDSPLVLNIVEQFSFDGFHKKCVNVCRDKIRQNNA